MGIRCSYRLSGICFLYRRIRARAGMVHASEEFRIEISLRAKE